MHDALITCSGEHVEEVVFGSDLKLIAKVYSPDGQMPGIGFGIATRSDIPVYGTFSEIHHANPYMDDEGFIIYEIKMPNIRLMPGLYDFKFHTMTPENIQMIDTFKRPLRITGKTRELGCYQIKTQWK